MNRSFCQQQPDSARNIALYLSPPEISNYCQSEKACDRVICKKQRFWKMKYQHDYPNDFSLPIDGNWYRHYQKSLATLYLYTSVDSSIITSGVRQVSCGKNHCGLVTVAGNLYMWGLNRFSQLGLKDVINVKDPTFIKENVEKIICDSDFSIYITENSESYIVGRVFRDNFPQFTFLAENCLDAAAWFGGMGIIDLQNNFLFKPRYKENFQHIANNVKSLCLGSRSFITLDNIYHNINYIEEFVIEGIIKAKSDIGLTENNELIRLEVKPRVVAKNVVDFDARGIRGPAPELCFYSDTGQIFVGGLTVFGHKTLSPEIFSTFLNLQQFTRDPGQNIWNTYMARLEEHSQKLFNLDTLTGLSRSKIINLLLDLPDDEQYNVFYNIFQVNPNQHQGEFLYSTLTTPVAILESPDILKVVLAMDQVGVVVDNYNPNHVRNLV